MLPRQNTVLPRQNTGLPRHNTVLPYKNTSVGSLRQVLAFVPADMPMSALYRKIYGEQSEAVLQLLGFSTADSKWVDAKAFNVQATPPGLPFGVALMLLQERQVPDKTVIVEIFLPKTEHSRDACAEMVFEEGCGVASKSEVRIRWVGQKLPCDGRCFDVSQKWLNKVISSAQKEQLPCVVEHGEFATVLSIDATGCQDLVEE
jgi:hypothetical protein